MTPQEHTIALSLQEQFSPSSSMLNNSLFLSAAIVFIVLTSASSSSLSVEADACFWRFDNCSRPSQGSPCVVRMRMWCGCGINDSCVKDSYLEVNSSTATAQLGALDSFCDLSSCTVVPRRCEWTLWRIYFDVCVLVHRSRVRNTCCHPVYTTQSISDTSNATCSQFQAERQVRTKYQSRDYCNRSRNRSSDSFPPDGTTGSGPERESWWKKNELYLCFLLVLLLIPLTVAAERWKRRRQGLSGRSGGTGRSRRSSPPIVIDLRGEESRPLPENAVIPQPGQPLSEELLKS